MLFESISSPMKARSGRRQHGSRSVRRGGYASLFPPLYHNAIRPVTKHQEIASGGWRFFRFFGLSKEGLVKTPPVNVVGSGSLPVPSGACLGLSTTPVESISLKLPPTSAAKYTQTRSLLPHRRSKDFPPASGGGPHGSVLPEPQSCSL